MKTNKRRLDLLEALTPDRKYPSLSEYLELERTEGTKENTEFSNLYNENRYENAEKSNR